MNEITISIMGEKWNLDICQFLDGRGGNVRYFEIRDGLGISDKVLSARLKQLKLVGIVERTTGGGNFTAVFYCLSEYGVKVLGALDRVE